MSNYEVTLMGVDWIGALKIAKLCTQAIEEKELVHQNRGQQLTGKYQAVFQESLSRCTEA